MESTTPLPLPKRPSNVQSEPAGPVTEKSRTGTVPSPRIPARPAPPKPVSRPASVHVPHKDASSVRSHEKSAGGAVNKRKIEITILDARPMSEINFRDLKSSNPKPPASPKQPHYKAENHSVAKQAESSEISRPDVKSAQSPPPAPGEESNPSPPQPSLDADVESQKPLPPRPKRPTIIRPARSDKSEKENQEKLPPPATKICDSNDNIPPQKPSRLSKSDSSSREVDTPKSNSLLSGSQTNQLNDQEQPQPELECPVISSRPKRPTIIRPGKSVSQDGDAPSTGQKEELKKPPPLPSRPPLPSSAPSVSVPPPLPSKSPASPPLNSKAFQPESTKLSPNMSSHRSDGPLEKKPVPKPRPRSVAVSSNIDVLSLASKNEQKDFPLAGSTKGKEMVRSISPPPLPTKAPRAASSSSEDNISSGITSLEKADTTPSHNVLKEDKKSQEKSGPARPKPLPPAATRNFPLPARPPPPGKKMATSHSDDENKHVSDDNKSQQSQNTETKDKFTDKDDEGPPIYAKINKTAKNIPPNQLKEAVANEADKEKTCGLPFKVKLKSTLNSSEESQADKKISESSTLTLEPGENQPAPKISPKPKPKPSLKPKPQPPVKPKPKIISPREPEVGEVSETAPSKPQRLQDKELLSSPVAEDRNLESPKTVNHEGKIEKNGKELGENITYSHREDSVAETIDSGEKKTWPNNDRKQAVQPGHPLPPKRPDGMKNQAVTNKETADKSHSNTVEERPLSTQSTLDQPPKAEQSSDAVQNNSGEMDISHEVQSEASSMPPRKKPVRIIGFPHRLSSVDSKAKDDEKEEELAMSERSKPSNKPPPRPPMRPSLPSKVVPTPALSRDMLKTSTESDVTANEGNSNQISVDEKKETEEGKDSPAQRRSLPSKPPPPAARPPPPQQISTSMSNPPTDVTAEEKEEQHPRTSLPGTLHSEESASLTHGTKNEKQESQDAVKPPKPRPPPPRPASVVHLKTPESTGTDSNHNDEKHKSLTEKPPSHQPSQRLPGGSHKSKSGPPTLPPRPGVGHILYNYIANQPHGIASHSYSASQPDELSFQAGETVLLTKQVDDQWMSGRVGETEGIFPKAFVEIKCPLEIQGMSSSSSYLQDFPDVWPHDEEFAEENVSNIRGPRCRARFDFEGCGEGELALEDGDVIQLLSRVGNEWLKGKLHDKEGIFPAAFVEVIEDLPEDQESSSHTDSTETFAIFDFEGQEGDLSFQAGDRIQVLGQINSEWLYGECNGLKGQFPVSFISSVPPCLPKFEPSSVENNDDTITGSPVDLPTQTPDVLLATEKAPPPVIASCVALHDYESNTPGDLQFKSGEIIKIVEVMGEDWLSGRLHGEEGIFPRVFVELPDFLSPDEPAGVPILGKAVHSFSGRDDTELTFEEGSVIELEEFVDESQEWRWGTFQGHRGMFPSNFVDRIR